MPDLSDLIPADAVRVDVAASDWREAIRAAGALLEQSGAATAEYTDRMIESVEEHGPYIVIAPGFAFAHARPDASVRRTGMSLVRLAEPVEFGHKTNDPVTLVLALSAVDDDAHRGALARLAGLLADPEGRRSLDEAATAEELAAALRGDAAPAAAPAAAASADSGSHLVYTVCGNGLGTSLFLKNTLEQVLERWGWSRYVTVEATDTISARGKAKDAAFILTSGEIAKALGDVGVPVEVIENFTSQAEVDEALRRRYDV